LELPFVQVTNILGFFIGEPPKLDSWLHPKIDHWLSGIHQLTQAAKWYPQAAYAALQKSLKMEWQYLQHVVEDCKLFFPSQGCSLP